MQNGRRGFTLIELLVVIAIIAVLAAIIFPVYAMVKKSARNAADLSNLNQIGMNFRQYLSDNNNCAPPFLWGGAGAGYCPINEAANYIAPNDQRAKADATRKFSYQEDGYGNTLYNYYGLLATGAAAAPADYYTAILARNWAGLNGGAAAWQGVLSNKFTNFPMLANRSRPGHTVVTWSPYQRKDSNNGGAPYDTGTVLVLRVDGSAKAYANDRGDKLFVADATGLAPIQYQSQR